MFKKTNLVVWIAIPFIFCLLAACASSSRLDQGAVPVVLSASQRLTGYLTLQDGRLIEYTLLVPESWPDTLEVRKDGNNAYYDYNASPKQTLFSISALTESEWQEAQQELGHGEEVLSQDGIVYIYHVALDNPYAGSQAEEFQQMAGEVKNVVNSLSASVISTEAEMEQARNTLYSFFDLLPGGNYIDAVKLYGGTYENLIEMNPGIDQNDHTALLKQACTINGFQCLPIRKIVKEIQSWPDTFTFTVEFSNPDGSLFEIGACCGGTEPNMQRQSQFDFNVTKVAQAGDIYLVQTLPVYVP